LASGPALQQLSEARDARNKARLVSYVDNQFGALHEAGQPQDTKVILFADHRRTMISQCRRNLHINRQSGRER
jgi:hypothetical protein